MKANSFSPLNVSAVVPGRGPASIRRCAEAPGFHRAYRRAPAARRARRHSCRRCRRSSSSPVHPASRLLRPPAARGFSRVVAQYGLTRHRGFAKLIKWVTGQNHRLFRTRQPERHFVHIGVFDVILRRAGDRAHLAIRPAGVVAVDDFAVDLGHLQVALRRQSLGQIILALDDAVGDTGIRLDILGMDKVAKDQHLPDQVCVCAPPPSPCCEIMSIWVSSTPSPFRSLCVT